MNEYTKSGRIFRMRDAAGNEFKIPTRIERNDVNETGINAYISREAMRAGSGGELCQLVFSVNLNLEMRKRDEEVARQKEMQRTQGDWDPYGRDGKYW